MSRSRAARIGLGAAGLLLLAILVLAVTAVIAVRRPFPKTDGAIDVPGLSSAVTIHRDEFGVPHIYAESEADLFFAQGYVHAQDRFWQMEFWRHTGQGRLSEIVGEATLDTDRFIRTLGWNRIAAETVAYYQEEEPAYYALLEAYSAGVNAYVDANRNALSINKTILELVGEPWEIEPWEPVDTIGWGVVMSWDLSGGNMGQELARVRLNQAVGEANAANLLPFYPYEDRPVMIPTGAMEFLEEAPDDDGDEDAPPAEENEEEAPLEESDEAGLPGYDWSRVSTDLIGALPPTLFGQGEGIGSNNWVLSGEHTASGLPLLANDPHLGIQMPSIWYEVGLHGAGYDVTGFSFAGVPGVVIGHNAQIAWGVTNVNPDIIDLYIERINPSNPLQYEWQGEWRDMEIIEEVIKINGGAEEVVEVRLTHHGPIINEVTDADQDVLALRWTAYEPSRILESVIRLNQAANFDEFRAALTLWDIPSQNVVYADVDGNIGYQMPGLVPIRAAGDGMVPVPGWTGEYEWTGWIPFDDLPRVLNPEWGYVVTANHAIVDADYPYLISNYWAPGDRGQRIVDMLEAAMDAGAVDADDFARIQSDSYSLLAERYVPLLEGLSSPDGDVQAALERLRGWDRQVRRDSVPAALFEAWFAHLTWNVLIDDVGEANIDRVRGAVFFHQLAESPDARWWDDTTTSAKESREEIMLASLADAVDWFKENIGDDANEWTWGAIHTATFVSTPLGASGIGPLEALVNLGPVPVDGGQGMVNATSYSYSDLAAVRAIPSMRMIVDLSDLDASRSVHATGQSGHPYHPHYDDMLPLWQNGEYHAMLFSREAVEAAAAQTLRLRPADD